MACWQHLHGATPGATPHRCKGATLGGRGGGLAASGAPGIRAGQNGGACGGRGEDVLIGRRALGTIGLRGHHLQSQYMCSRPGKSILAEGWVSHAMPCQDPRHAMPCRARIHAMPCHAMPCHATQRQAKQGRPGRCMRGTQQQSRCSLPARQPQKHKTATQGMHHRTNNPSPLAVVT